jgi:hypothetical protein
MHKISEWAPQPYNYCTDFVINLANMLHLSYYEINFLFFCLIYPVALMVSFSFYVAQRQKLKKQENGGDVNSA